MHDIKETGARSTSGHTFKQAIPPIDLVEAYLSVRLFSFFLFFFFFFYSSFFSSLTAVPSEKKQYRQ